MRVNDFNNISSSITLDKAIELGEYDEQYLSKFPEWKMLSPNIRWQLIRRAIKNKKRILRMTYAEIFNQLDFSKKPKLSIALKNTEKELEKLSKDEEKLLLKYSS